MLSLGSKLLMLVTVLAFIGQSVAASVSLCSERNHGVNSANSPVMSMMHHGDVDVMANDHHMSMSSADVSMPCCEEQCDCSMNVCHSSVAIVTIFAFQSWELNVPPIESVSVLPLSRPLPNVFRPPIFA